VAEETSTTLPEYDNMQERLTRTDNNPDLISHFYPIILQSAGREFGGSEVVDMLISAIHSYTQAMHPAMRALMLLRLDRYIEALVDNETVCQEALNHWKGVMSELRRT
jgi:hypothetical protein